MKLALWLALVQMRVNQVSVVSVNNGMMSGETDMNQFMNV
jgi:hypothetical protein